LGKGLTERCGFPRTPYRRSENSVQAKFAEFYFHVAR
jgi:hypothetical protein